MLKYSYICLVCFLVSTVQCQTYEERVNTKLASIDANRIELTATFTGLRSNLAVAQTAITSLTSSIPAMSYNDVLSESISMMDILSSDQAGRPDSYCFLSYTTAKPTLVPSAQQAFSQCVFVLNSRITQQTTLLNSNIAALTTGATTARNRLVLCNNTRFQVSAALFDYCVSSSTGDFDKTVSAYRSSVADLTARKTAIGTDLAECVSSNVIASQRQLSSVVDAVKRCLQSSTSADAPRLIPLLPTVTINATTFISDQVTPATTASTDVTAAKTKYQEAIDLAKKDVEPAAAVKALTLASARIVLETTFATTKAAFDKAVSSKSSVPAAASCVQNIRNALANTITKHMNQYVECVVGIRSGPLSSELNQIQNLFSEAVGKEGDTVIQCLVQTTNIPIAEGILQCRNHADADEANFITYLAARATTLKEEAAMVTAAGTRCKEYSINNAKRQNQKDKQAFENCIQRTTRTTYTITIE